MVIIRVEIKKKGKVSTGGMLNLLKGISVAWTPLFKVIPLKLLYYQTFLETWHNQHS